MKGREREDGANSRSGANQVTHEPNPGDMREMHRHRRGREWEDVWCSEDGCDLVLSNLGCVGGCSPKPSKM